MRLGQGEYVHSALVLEREQFFYSIFEVEPESRTLLDDVRGLPLRDTLLEWEEYSNRAAQTAAAWVKRWHLLDEWCARMAEEFFVLGNAFYLPPRSTGRSFRFERPFYWHRGTSTRAAAEAAARAVFEYTMRDSFDNEERQARAEGLEKAPKRNPEHYRWLARYQCKGESTVSIWKSLNGDRRTYEAVKKAIRETAVEIGLTRR
jgi:hypothetical protein